MPTYPTVRRPRTVTELDIGSPVKEPPTAKYLRTSLLRRSSNLSHVDSSVSAESDGPQLSCPWQLHFSLHSSHHPNGYRSYRKLSTYPHHITYGVRYSVLPNFYPSQNSPFLLATASHPSPLRPPLLCNLLQFAFSTPPLAAPRGGGV